MLQQQCVQLLAALDDDLQRTALDPQTEVDRDTFEVDAVAGQGLNVGIVHEADAIEVDDAEVRGVTLDLTDVDHLIYLLLFLITKFKGTCVVRPMSVLPTVGLFHVNQQFKSLIKSLLFIPKCNTFLSNVISFTKMSLNFFFISEFFNFFRLTNVIKCF